MREGVDILRTQTPAEPGAVVCAHCGQAVPARLTWDRDLGILMCGADRLRMGRTRARLFDAVYRAGSAGVPIERLVDFLYGDDPNGGPLAASNVVQARIWLLNAELKRFAIKISAIQRGRGHHGIYRLVTCEARV